jgi:N-acetylglucosamine kinase-like BadF-type ATPase
MLLFLGIDGGATRTVAWVGNEQGKVVGRFEAGPSNPLKVGFEAAQKELLRASRGALRQARSSRSGVAGLKREAKPALVAVCAGIAGVDRRQLHRRLLAWLRSYIPARHHLLTVDAAIALRAALGDKPGVIVISGTGSIAYGQEELGHIERAGGWGIPFDDLGSGYDLGRKAIMSALQQFDGRGPRTDLTQLICRSLGLEQIIQIVPHPPVQQGVAALFPLVLRAARQGDKVAKDLCRRAGLDLATLARAVVERYGWRRRTFTIVMAGGVLKSSPLIRDVFARSVRSFAPRAELEILRREPVEGALELARSVAVPHRTS